MGSKGFVALVLLSRRTGASLLLSHARACEIDMRRPLVIMKNLMRVLLSAALLCSVSFGVLANDQKKDDQKPPPKESTPKVVHEEKKDNSRGNSNSQQNDPKKGNDNKGKP